MDSAEGRPNVSTEISVRRCRSEDLAQIEELWAPGPPYRAEDQPAVETMYLRAQRAELEADRWIPQTRRTSPIDGRGRGLSSVGRSPAFGRGPGSGGWHYGSGAGWLSA